jgi:hypothetical protein
MCILAVVDRAVDGDSPHAGCIAITVAIIVFPPVTTCPHIDVTKSVSTLNSTESNDDFVLGFVDPSVDAESTK